MIVEEYTCDPRLQMFCKNPVEILRGKNELSRSLTTKSGESALRYTKEYDSDEEVDKQDNPLDYKVINFLARRMFNPQLAIPRNIRFHTKKNMLRMINSNQFLYNKLITQPRQITLDEQVFYRGIPCHFVGSEIITFPELLSVSVNPCVARKFAGINGCIMKIIVPSGMILPFVSPEFTRHYACTFEQSKMIYDTNINSSEDELLYPNGCSFQKITQIKIKFNFVNGSTTSEEIYDCYVYKLIGVGLNNPISFWKGLKQTLDKVKLVDNSEKSDESDDSDESDNSDESNESNDSNKDDNPSKKQIDVSNESILLPHSYNARSQTFSYNTRSKTRSQTFGYNTRSKSRSQTFGYNTSSNPGIKKPKSKKPKSKKSKSRKSYKRRKH